MKLLALLTILLASSPSLALDDAHAAKAEAAIARAIDFLRSTQNPDGAWTPEPGPAITGLVVAGILRSPDIHRDDPAIARALQYILARQKPDGGIYDEFLRNYNTAICLMALGRVGDDPAVQQAIQRAQHFLESLQWSDGMTDPAGNPVTPQHPYYGGAGYGDGQHGRPDGSNTFIMLSALYDSGYDCNSATFRRAVAYVSRLQGIPSNDLLADKIVNDGGFIYATSIDKDHIGTPQTRTDDSLADAITKGEKAEYDAPLPTYGSMTYAGYMSYLYAQLDRDDPRVIAARQWIADNYTVETHPRMGEKSYYYYMHFFARALRANGEQYITTPNTSGGGVQHDWANDLIDALLARQRDDGSWSNDTDKWMEGDPNLATAYALIALQVALGR